MLRRDVDMERDDGGRRIKEHEDKRMRIRINYLILLLWFLIRVPFLVTGSRVSYLNIYFLS